MILLVPDQFHNIIEEHANLIVSKMEQDPALIENSPASDDLRRLVLIFVSNDLNGWFILLCKKLS